MLIKDIQCRNNVMFDHVDKDIVVAQISIVRSHKLLKPFTEEVPQMVKSRKERNRKSQKKSRAKSTTARGQENKALDALRQQMGGEE